MRLLLLGPQGSGKTTQAKLLAQRLNVCAILAGEMMRDIAQEDSVRGQSVRESLKHGQMVDSQIVTEAVQTKISQPEAKLGFVIDGPPRKLSDMEFFNPDFDAVIYLSVPDQVVEERLLKRGRSDDTLDLIRTRLAIYHQQTQPILEHFKSLGKLIQVDASHNVDQVTREILEKVKGRLGG